MMFSAYDDLMQIVDDFTPVDRRTFAMRGFATQLQWTPSYEIHGSFGVDAAKDHLVVEHGLENSAIISFLRAPYRARDLDLSQLRLLLGISYNNLVEWHIFVSQTDVRQVNNLSDVGRDELGDRVHSLARSDFVNRLSAAEIDKLLSADGIRRTYSSCDDALIQAISRWKRMLKAALSSS